MPTNEPDPHDFVDTPHLPGSDLARTGLVVITSGAAGLLIFWLIVGLFSNGGLAHIDLMVMEALHEDFDTTDPIGPDWFDSVMRDVTALGSNTIVVAVTLLAAALMAMTHRIGPAVLLSASVLGAFVLNSLLKMAFDRERPDFLSLAVTVNTTSFPSSHAMLSAVLFLLIGAIAARETSNRAVGVVCLATAAATAALVGFSRIYLGAHWPSDVMAGWAIGAASALAAWQLARSPRPPS